jgi:hypothetical protein
LPLMSLGLMLDQLQLAGPYDPYAGP